MYKGFNVDLTRWEYLDNVSQKDINQFTEIDDKIAQKIASFSLADGKLDGSKMTADWFPIFEADIFISHSHNDLNKATALAVFLKRLFGLNCFIDSNVWKHGDALLSLIDRRYCWNSEHKTFNYQKRNYSTSHVHMMLTMALCTMIDKAECLFFLNTPESITPFDTVSATESPWIYSEIAMSRLIRRKSKEAHRGETKMFTSKSLNEDINELKILHQVNLDHLIDLDLDDLNQWLNLAGDKKGKETLDVLYGFDQIPPQTQY